MKRSLVVGKGSARVCIVWAMTTVSGRQSSADCGLAAVEASPEGGLGESAHVGQRSARRGEMAGGGGRSPEGRPRSVSEQAVGGAADARGAAVQDMGVDHRRRDVLVAEELLDGAEVAAVLEEMGGEGVAKGMAGGPLRNSRREDGSAHGLLKDGLVQVVPAALSALLVSVEVCGGKDPLPAWFCVDAATRPRVARSLRKAVTCSAPRSAGFRRPWSS